MTITERKLMIDPLGHMFRCKGNSIFSNDRFTCRCMGSNENTVSQFESVNSFFLEVIEFERILDVCQMHNFESVTMKN